MIERLEELGRERHFLYLATPRTGDLGILYHAGLDREAFARQIRELLHGEGDAPERLERYAVWVDRHGLPNKWTFPTYFLFLVQPDRNLFVKPTAMGRFLELVEAGFELGSRPSGEVYARLLEVAEELRQAILDGVGEDMVAVQSLIWVVGRQTDYLGVRNLDGDRGRALHRLLGEFVRTFPDTEEGRAHLAAYPALRQSARENFERILAARDAGEDVTDLVLTKLLPHKDTPGNRARGAWIHVAPAVNADVRTWFEGAGWARPEDSPGIGRAILELVESVVEDPDRLEAACRRFSDRGPLHRPGGPRAPAPVRR